MSRPLWPEDMETLCPSVPLRMRHALPIYCNILLHVAVWPHTDSGSVEKTVCLLVCFCCLLDVLFFSCCLFSACYLSFSATYFSCMSPLFPQHSFFLSLFIFFTTRQLQTWRYHAPYHHDAWPPASAPCPPPPRRHDVTIAADSSLLFTLVTVKDNTFQTVSASVTVTFP